MEHEVFVPVPAASLRRTLSDPARVARCVPGLQRDADDSAGPLAGRLRIRAGGHTITYRGALRVTGRGGDAFSVTGEGTEARGTGSVKLALTIGLAETDGGTMLEFTGTVSGDGRIVELDEDAGLAAAHRLVDRFTQQLVTESLAAHEASGPGHGEPGRGESGPAVEPGGVEPGGVEPGAGESGPAAEQPASGTGQEAVEPDGGAGAGRAPGEPASAAGEQSASAADEQVSADEQASSDASADEQAPSDEAADEQASSDGASSDGASSGRAAPGNGAVFDAPVPPSSLDPAADMEFTVPDEPPAEAAHARRTMIGRSTEEVDHAPPRGRYAPEPSQDALTSGRALRWVAPAAALAIASAVVVGRALRRRR